MLSWGDYVKCHGKGLRVVFANTATNESSHTAVLCWVAVFRPADLCSLAKVCGALWFSTAQTGQPFSVKTRVLAPGVTFGYAVKVMNEMSLLTWERHYAEPEREREIKLPPCCATFKLFSCFIFLPKLKYNFLGWTESQTKTYYLSSSCIKMP